MILVVDRLTDFGFSVLGIILGASSRTEKPNPFNRSITINIGFFEIPHFFVQGGSTDQLLNMWGQTPHMR